MRAFALGTCLNCGRETRQAWCDDCGGLVVIDGDSVSDDGPTVGSIDEGPPPVRIELAVVHGLTDEPAAHRCLVLDEAGLTILDEKDEPWWFAPRETLTRIAVEDSESVQHRLSAGRFALLGAWAVLSPRRTTISYLTIEGEDFALLVEVPSVAPVKLRKMVTPWTTAPAPPAIATDDPKDRPESATPRERLQVLDDLRRDDLISAAEYDERRKQILDSL